MLVCPNKNYLLGSLGSSDRYMTEVQCLPSQSESRCHERVQKKRLAAGKRELFRDAGCAILLLCSSANPSRRLVAAKNESRILVVELL